VPSVDTTAEAAAAPIVETPVDNTGAADVAADAPAEPTAAPAEEQAVVPTEEAAAPTADPAAAETQAEAETAQTAEPTQEADETEGGDASDASELEDGVRLNASGITLPAGGSLIPVTGTPSIAFTEFPGTLTGTPISWVTTTPRPSIAPVPVTDDSEYSETIDEDGRTYTVNVYKSSEADSN